MKHEDLFAIYKSTLKWIDRRRDPETAEFYKETPESWKHAKEVAFNVYQNARRYCDEPLPSLYREHKVDHGRKEAFGPYKGESGSEFPCLGSFKYRDLEFPVYDDVYGMSMFTVYDGHIVQVDSFGGETDWYYELDRLIDKIDN